MGGRAAGKEPQVHAWTRHGLGQPFTFKKTELPNGIFVGPNAAMHMLHYVDASGRNLTINLEDMVEPGPTATGRFKNEVRQAQGFVESLSVGTHSIASKPAESAYNFKNESNP